MSWLSVAANDLTPQQKTELVIVGVTVAAVILVVLLARL